MIDKNITIADLLKEYPHSKEVLEANNMFCSVCPFAEPETLEQAASKHDVDLDELIKQICEKN
jgi:hybrid cluster-associated redox disulfide protein